MAPERAFGISENFKTVGRIDVVGGGQVTVENGYAYVGHMGPQDGQIILDVSDPRNPRIVSHLMVPPGVHRMDGAGFLSPKIAEAKAFSAAAWRRPTIALGEIVERFPQFLTGVSMMADGKVVVTEGGHPLRDAGAVIGGLGVSGGKPDQDRVCCEAGLAAVGLSIG